MKSRKLILVTVLILFAALTMSVGFVAQDKQERPHNQVRYSIKFPGTLGGAVSIAQGINNRGQVVGGASLPGDTAFHAFLWQHGVMRDLGSLQGGPFSVTYTNPNERGEVSGYSNTQTPDPNGEDFCLDGNQLICLGFLWRNGVMEALPTLGGNNGQAFQLNIRGQVVGVAENTTQDSTCTAFNLEAKPVVWRNGRIQELPTIFGDPDGWGYGINDQGQIVGASGTCFANQPAASLHALLWQDGPEGGVMDLGNLGGTNSNIAFYISNRGQVVGLSGVPGDIYWHAFLWTNKDGMRDLGTLPGDFYSLANNINNKNEAVGISFPATGDGRAVIWQNGVINDLNTLIPPGSHLYLLEAFGINDRGQIAGWGRLANGDHRAFLLTPCDEERPNDKGCKDDAAAATDVDPASAAQHPGTLIPGNRMPPGMLNRFRFAWGQRNLGSETESAPDHRQERPGDTANDDLLGDQILPPGWCWPHCKHHSGSCEVDSNGRLDGQCAGSQFGQCLIQGSANCPRGKRAIRPTVEQCGHGFPVTVDLARKCSF